MAIVSSLVRVWAAMSSDTDTVAASAPVTNKSRGKFTMVSPINKRKLPGEFEVLRVNKRLTGVLARECRV